MKYGLGCPIEHHYFDHITSAKCFAHRYGVEDAFFTGPECLQQSGAVMLYGYPDWVTLIALVIVYPQSHEIGLWVRPQYRQQGWGRKAFQAVIKSTANTNEKQRLFARVDATGSGAKAMRTILLDTGFKQILPTNGGALELWALPGK